MTRQTNGSLTLFPPNPEMFTDPAFQVRSTIDKRGRKLKASKSANDDIKRYYRLQEEEEEELDGKTGKTKQNKKDVSSDDNNEEEEEEEEVAAANVSGSSEEESEEESEEARHRERWARMRGLTGPESSSDEDEDADSDDDDDDNNIDIHKSSSDNDLLSSSEDDEDQDNDALEEGKAARIKLAMEQQEQDLKAELAEWGVGALAANPEEPILLLPEATSRLAVVDLDWDHVRAVDIFAVLRSFVPSGGRIKKVTVYPSDYGLERMKEEATLGPRGIWKKGERNLPAELLKAIKGGNGNGGGGGGGTQDKRVVEHTSNSNDDEDSDDSDDSQDEEDIKEDQDRLQKYERSRLRYYYAIVTCDTPITANQIYEECDGMEFMKTACKFDLRFVPDDSTHILIKDRVVRDEALDVPSDYQPPNFQTKALQHTKVQLTWDGGDETRKRTLSRKVKAEELKEDDFRAYLASSSEEEEEKEEDEERKEERDQDDDADADDGAKVRQRYLALLNGGGNVGVGVGNGNGGEQQRKGTKDWAAVDDASSDEDEEEVTNSRSKNNTESIGALKRDKNMEMEVTFVPGLENLGIRLLAKKQEERNKKGETVWDAYLRRKREKKVEAKKMGKHHVDSDSDENISDGLEDSEEGNSEDEDDLPAGVADDPFFQHKNDPFDDPFFTENDGGGGGNNNKSSAADPMKKDKKKKSRNSRKDGNGVEVDEEEEQRKKAELELLLMDEKDLLLKSSSSSSHKVGAINSNGITIGDPFKNKRRTKKVSMKERMRMKREAKRLERQEGSDDEDIAAGDGKKKDFKPDLDDPRFSGLFTSPDYALDPTDPRYGKAGTGAAVVASEVAKRRSKQLVGKEGRRAVEGGEEGEEMETRRSGGGEIGGRGDLKLMVASLKRKVSGRSGDTDVEDKKQKKMVK
jgi:hypothetical protein